MLRIRLRRPLLAALVGVAAALTVGGPALAEVVFDSSPPFHGAKRSYELIEAKHSGLLLNVPGASTVNGTQIVQWDGKSNMHGQWEAFLGSSGDGGAIRNRWSRQCLDVDSTAVGTPVVQRPCDGTISQKWTINSEQEAGDPAFRNITNRSSGLDLNISGGSTALGAKLIQWPRVKGAPNAMFRVSAPVEFQIVD